jgi:hypothetical protein
MNDDSVNDDIIDERIRALAAGHFNAPDGEPPREAMWDGIAAARRVARAAGASPTVAGAPMHETKTIAITPRRSHAAAWRWGAALAAGLVLGIVVDRQMVRDSSPAKGVDVAAVPPSTAPATKAPVTPESSDATTPLPSPRRVAITPPSTPRSSQLAPSRVESVASRPLATRVPADSAAQALYRVAAGQTLVQAEALLTSYRNNDGARDPQAMLQAARWARDVLSSTRLLIDSPAGRDPQMRALLSDLELILAQLVQLSGTPLQSGERDLIERAMRERDLLPRLRSAVPAGLAAS